MSIAWIAQLERATSVVGCLAWVPITIWTIALVGWMVTGDVDPLFGIVAIAIGLALGVAAMVPPVPGMEGIFVMASITMVVAFPIVRASLTRRELAGVDIETMERCYEAIEMKPNNLGARFRLARVCWDRGLFGHAIAQAEPLLSGMPIQHFRDEHRTVQRWKASPLGADAFNPVPCLECGQANVPGQLHCQRCGNRFLLDAAGGKFVGRATGRKLIAGWACLMAILVGVPTASQALSPLAALLVILAIIVGVVTVMVLAFRPERRTR